MIIQRSKTFIKQYGKLTPKLQKQFDERLRLFIVDPSSPRLRIHPLKADYKGYWSMDISGDVRALYMNDGDRIIIFGFIGTHSQLYG
jgi:addiction module RelE/StbE family toxin